WRAPSRCQDPPWLPSYQIRRPISRLRLASGPSRCVICADEHFWAPNDQVSLEMGRTLLFTSEAQLKILSEAEVCGSDGTFSSRCNGAEQKLIILAHVPIKPGSSIQVAVPVATAYMERRREDDYFH